MTPEEREALLLKVKSDVAEAMKTAAESNKTALEEMKTKLEDISKNDLLVKSKEVMDELVKMAGELKALKETPAEAKGHATLKEALVSAFEAKKSELEDAVKGGQKAPIRVTVKTVGTMSVESTIGAGSTFNTITENTGIISTIRKRELTYLANVSVGSIGSNRAVWIEETDEEGTPIMLGEGDAKTQLDVQYVEQTASVKKIAVYGKVTTELMADIPQLISYIQNNLMKRLDIVLEDQYFYGNNVGDNLKGVDSYATAFSAGALANSIPKANEFDVLEAIALQSKLAFGVPNAVFVNPSTVAAMKLVKDDQGRPVWKDYVTITGNLVVSGMKVIESTAIAAGDFIGGDMTVVNVLIREEMGIQIGLDGNDFTQNKKTMLVEKRIAQFVSANDTAVIVTGDFATAKAALLIV